MNTIWFLLLTFDGPTRPLKASGWKSPLRMRILGGSHVKHGARTYFCMIYDSMMSVYNCYI